MELYCSCHSHNDAISWYQSMNDLVEQPAHYTEDKEYETIEVIRNELSDTEFVGYLKGSVIKYQSRAGKKGPALQDWYKARWFLNRLIGLFE